MLVVQHAAPLAPFSHYKVPVSDTGPDADLCIHHPAVMLSL